MSMPRVPSNRFSYPQNNSILNSPIAAGWCSPGHSFKVHHLLIWTTFFVDYFPKSKSQTVVLLANRGGLRQPTSMVELSRQMTRLDKYIIANENSSTCSDRIGLERILKYRNSFRQHAQAFCRGGSSSVQCDATIGDKNISSDYICVGENL
mmetsp:Transcript_6746/g.5545  ORF Transcript_6746/g.5545 Transcript_6746/m.5545 type:complete len:151 (+) Transcript_6746:3-455(+)